MPRATATEPNDDNAIWLIVGLGNPGEEYRNTRHNVGEAAVNLIAQRLGERLRGGRDNALITETRLDGHRVILSVPITYMNESGRSVQSSVRRHRIEDATHIIVIHDELDLEPGVVRVKAGGGLAGHNGLRSITQHLHTQDYFRERIGVGKPTSKEHGAKHVLAKISRRDQAIFDTAVADAADAASSIVTEGFDATARVVNAR
jgi:PTH1 family peptidyl-tRNA hydrolase